MSENGRVIWYEGMALKPHHFQQHDRYLDYLVKNYPNSLGSYAWGINKIVIDQSQLKLGKIAIDESSGCFPDGTIFDFPRNDQSPPAPIEINKTCKDMEVFLALPMNRFGMPHTSLSGESTDNIRYGNFTAEIIDRNINNNSTQMVEIVSMNMKLLCASDARDYYTCIGIAKIKEVSPDNTIILDDNYIPACISVSQIDPVRKIIQELSGLIHNRGEALAQQLNDIHNAGSAELKDFLVLQFINAYEVQLKHFLNKKNLHPERLFEVLIKLMAEFSTFTYSNRRPIDVPVYRHDKLQETFSPVLSALRSSLSMILKQNAVMIPLEKQESSISVATFEDKTLLDESDLILVVKAKMAHDDLIKILPSKIKLAPVEKIQNYVLKAIPGIQLRHLAAVPRQLPFNPGAVYFEIDKENILWESLKNSGGLAIHASSSLSDMELMLWAVKGN